VTEACVFLVGAGPGDPGLLTVRALELIESADIVVYDRLISSEILARIPAGVPKIFVGKAAGNHSIPQPEINSLLVSLARRERRIVRLKGGDPFVFGRGGEEAEHLAQHGIAFEIVPGVTAATACAAYAGIPLTHRGLANSVRFIAGHCRDDKPLDLHDDALADPHCTLVVFMGLANIERIVTAALQAGRSPTTPVAIIESGTTPQQRCIRCELASLRSEAQANGVSAPALIVIGEVVSMAAILDWYQPAIEQATTTAKRYA
jgi:uroporphyrin-III C-methyltransferase/precorrin-2 dehydrogenase/sirohydrochlorin ferrochelatase/uroporphyrin-III C-methyltransferase